MFTVFVLKPVSLPITDEVLCAACTDPFSTEDHSISYTEGFLNASWRSGK